MNTQKNTGTFQILETTPKATLNTKALRRLGAAVVLVAVALTGTTAQAGIVGMGGDATGPWYGGGNDLTLGGLTNNTQTNVFRELATFTLPANITYNAHAVGQYNQLSDLTNQIIPNAGIATVTSWILHFDPTAGTGKNSNGYIDFDHEIYVISRDIHISPTDSTLGNPTNNYPSWIVDRGYDLVGNDQFTISNPSSGIWRLAFDANATVGLDQIRVVEVESVPAPGSLALLGLGGLITARRRR